jgi:hypothetical protein
MLISLSFKTSMSQTIRTEAHARKMKVISSGITFMGNKSTESFLGMGSLKDDLEADKHLEQ